MAPVIALEMAAPPDVVTIEHDTAVALGDGLGSVAPRVLTVHNVTAEYYRTRARSDRGLTRIAWEIESRRVDRYISPRLGQFARLVAMSDKDAGLLRSRTDTPVDIVPNGTVMGPPLTPSEAGPTVLFTGTMNHPPNRDAVLWFHACVWPAVLRSVPDAVLLVVGRHPQKEVAALGATDAAVRVTGEVRDMTPFLAEATVVVAPLLSGGGTRLKILDAFAAERPVVATTIGAEGLDVTHGEQLLIADDAQAFASATISLLRDAELSRAIAARGRCVAAERYDWATLGLRLSDILAAVADEARATGSTPDRS